MTTPQQISDLSQSNWATSDLLAKDNAARTTNNNSIANLITFLNGLLQLSESQVTNLSSNLASKLALSGGTLTGVLNLFENPQSLLEAAPRQYVDAIGNGFIPYDACYAASTADLNATYANGSSGVGATLTDASGSFALFTTDNVAISLGQRVFVPFQSSAFQNGIYTLTQQGDTISVPWILTRAGDFNSVANIFQFAFVTILNGFLYGQTEFYLENAGPYTLGSTDLDFYQFSGATTALKTFNNLSDVTDAATARANLGITPIGTFEYAPVSGTSQSLSPDQGYFALNGGLTTFAMPSTIAAGQFVAVAGYGAGGWTIQLQTGQSAYNSAGNTSSGGTISSATRFDCAYVLCTVANTDFVIVNSEGTLTLA